MNRFIVITTIFEPSEAVVKFSQTTDYKLVVVGDLKTPPSWSCDNAIFLSIDAQKTLGFDLEPHLPHNHYCRKMLGYLYAISQSARLIVDTDDDNIPEDDWGFPDFDGSFPMIEGDRGFVNVYQLYTNERIWPRGLPLRLVNTDHANLPAQKTESNVSVGIWQGLANEDPDVDAIYRLVSDKPCTFDKRGHHVLGTGTITPFNSQNTAFHRDMFPLLYLPTTVTFRFTDILRSLVAQPIMWMTGRHLGFTNATVTQRRNLHDYMKDFESEIPMYLHTERTVEAVTRSVSAGRSLSDNLWSAYAALVEQQIVQSAELDCLSAWLSDCDRLLV